MLRFAGFSKALIAVLALAICQGCARHAEDYVRRGTEFQEKGKYAEAELQYLKALQKDDRSGEAHLRYGQLLADRNRVQEAYSQLSRAAELMPQSAEAQAGLGRVAVRGLLGDPRRPQFLYKTAERTATTLLSMNPNSFEGLRLRGYIAMADSQSKQAVEYFQKANRVKPNQPELINVLIENLLIDGQKAEAENLARQSLTTIKKYGPLYDVLYSLYMASNRTNEAEHLLRTKIANNPEEGLFVLQLAEFYWREKRIREMDDTVQGLAADSRRYPDAFLQAGDFYQRVGKPDQALAMYAKGIGSGGSQKEKCLQGSVQAYLSQGRKDEAAKVLDQILKAHPDDASSIASRAALRMATGKPEEIRKAIAEFSRAADKKPDDNQIRFGLATAYRQSGRLDASRTALREILRRDPRNRNALHEMADMAIRNHQPDDALRYAESLLEIDPNDLNARLVRTSVWAQRGLFVKVRSELDLLTAANPNLTEPWIQMATLDLEEKKYDPAEAIFRRLYKPGSGDIRVLRGLVSVYQARKQPEQGLTLARQEAQHSDSVEVRMLLATSAAQAGDVDLALATTQKLASDFPRNPDNLLFAGELFVRKGQMEQAIASFRKAHQVAPGDPLPWAHLGNALGRAGRYSEAVAAYQEFLKLRPGDSLVMNNLAWYLAQAGDLDQADRMAKQAVQKEPSNTQFSDTLAMVYMKSKKFTDAQQILQDLTNRAPNNAEYRTHLAMVLIESGQRRKARAELETALRNRPPADREQAIRKLLEPLQ